MGFLPHVVQADYRGGHRIHLRFSDAREKTVDYEGWLNGPVFEPLRDEAYFRQFFIEAGTVCWPNGADIAPETLYSAQEVHEAA